jgi:ribosome recycling factor
MPDNTGTDTELTPDAVLSEVERKMNRAIDALRRELNTLRTGRATPALLENITIEYYGVPTPLKQIASISAPDARAILVQPWDKQSLREIEKSLMKSEMGFNPSNDGNIITVPIPPLTQERRQELVRLLKRKIEEGKVSVRNGTSSSPRTRTAAVRSGFRKLPTPTSRLLMRLPSLKKRRLCRSSPCESESTRPSSHHHPNQKSHNM